MPRCYTTQLRSPCGPPVPWNFMQDEGGHHFLRNTVKRMKKIIMALLSALGLCRSRAKQSPGVYKGLREQVLNLRPEYLGINLGEFPDQVYAVIMDIGHEQGMTTLVSIIDGTTSLYFSNGGGILGCGKEESVKNASMHLLHLSEKYLKKMQKTTSFPPPRAGEVTFYVLTKNAIFTYTGSEKALAAQQYRISELFLAVRHVISEIRKIDKKRKITKLGIEQ